MQKLYSKKLVVDDKISFYENYRADKFTSMYWRIVIENHVIMLNKKVNEWNVNLVDGPWIVVMNIYVGFHILD